MRNQTISTPGLANVRVSDCMHPGVLTCGADDALQDVAAIMANHRVHAVVITNPDADRAVGVVSDMDIVAAVAAGAHCSAREAGATETLTVAADETVLTAAQLMSEHGVSHLVVVDGAGSYPVGILSTLDVATVLAGS